MRYGVLMVRPVASALSDNLENIDRVAAYTAGKSQDALKRKPMLHDAIERCLERVSEASRHIGADVKAGNPSVPWNDIASIGNRIRHGYFAVDPRIIWQTATLDPALRGTILDMPSKIAPGRWG